MTFRLVDTGWGQELERALCADRSELRIVCPFIKSRALCRLLALKPGRIRVITRFNLNEFAIGVSDVDALGTLLKRGAEVRGIRHLHAKMYLFGTTRAIVASANLTDAGLNRNSELGIVTQDPALIANCADYFEALWTRGRVLHQNDASDWTAAVNTYQASGASPRTAHSLGDFGADTGLPWLPEIPPAPPFNEAERAHVKFLGNDGNNRAPSSKTVLQELKDAGCHWAVAYRKDKRPRKVRDGDLVFLARLTNERDIRIFGRAIGLQHQDDRDNATHEEITERPWKADYCHYIRLRHAEFLNGSMRDGVSLNELTDTLGSDAFLTSQDRARHEGRNNVNPRRSYGQQPAVRLSPQGRAWLSERLALAFARHGLIPIAQLTKLDWPASPLPTGSSC